jgi:hypothetical protein
LTVAFLGVSFLTPLDSLFVLAALVPLAVLLRTEQQANRIRRLLHLEGPGRRVLIPVAAALVLLPALVAVAAAQPVVVSQQHLAVRADAEGFVVFDTSLSMGASAGPNAQSRLARAKRLAVRLQHALGDVPLGVASMTDRSLPNLLPTTDSALFARTVDQSVQIDSPPPSQLYPGRATTFDALIPIIESHFYSPRARRRLLVVLTDGEASKVSPLLLRLSLERRVTPVFVHVWAPGERIYRDGRPDPGYAADPSSGAVLAQVARFTDGKLYPEDDLSGVVHAARAAVGRAGTERRIDAYARVALAPWFVLGGVAPLGFLLWRRNV